MAVAQMIAQTMAFAAVLIQTSRGVGLVIAEVHIRACRDKMVADICPLTLGGSALPC